MRGQTGEPPSAEGRSGAGDRAQVVQSSQWNDTLQALGTAKARESISVTAKVSEIVEKGAL